MSGEGSNQAGKRPRWDLYEDRLLDAMQVLPLDREPQRGRVYRAVYQPAFHADTCVTVYDEGGQGAVEVVVAAPSVRAAVLREIGGRMGSGTQRAASGTDLQWEHADVPLARLQDFRTAVAGLTPDRLPDSKEDRGRDGMQVRGELGEGNGIHMFHTATTSATWYPAYYRYCLAVLDVALASVRDARSRFALLDIRRYLHER